MGVSSLVQYQVINKAETSTGGVRFAGEIGVELSNKTLTEATGFIWKLLDLNILRNRKCAARISLIIEDIDGVAYTEDNEMHISTRYIENCSRECLRSEVTGILYHETTHIWQWNGNGQTPGGLIEGIADFVRLKANYAPSHWVQPGQGDRWDQGYDVTARFLDYCNDLRNGFVAELNKKMIDDYSDEFFIELLGKSVDQLWSDYKAKYAK
ncbi:uncharacterized protein LOC8288104 [Ricinus communis]|uniref:Plant basic secretory protein (BSP) family protein n=1 Tax=Ricinus communis TaxID=3988 RepID=B9RY81_RICCO|nr:uncharacterized protein LOC8288104 [Ricinus communis]EEF43590.1 conserved hypothetical protein [Ricinus communis]